MRGFSLIELILVMALLSILFVLSAPLYQSFQVRNNLFVTVDVLSQNISRAQIRATYMEEDSAWGVKVNTTSNKIDNIILFKGTSYSGRDSSYDETFDLYSSIHATGDTEIIFNKLTGETSTGASATITITAPQIGSLQKVVTVNKKGNVVITD